MIIVEGCDNTGKSTLVAKLAEDLKLLVINNKRRPKDYTEASNYLHQVMTSFPGIPTILDRLCTISEPVYGPICRNTHIYSQAQLRGDLDFLLRHNPTIIYCRPPVATILGFGDRPQMEGVKDNARSIIGAYDLTIDQLALQGFRVVHWDYTNYDYKWIKQKVKHA